MGGLYPPGDPDIKIPVMRVFDQKDNSTFTLSFNQIDGFEFVEGTSYILNVEVTELALPPIDGHSKKYKLINIINIKQI